jgi:hypothetical protein
MECEEKEVDPLLHSVAGHRVAMIADKFLGGIEGFVAIRADYPAKNVDLGHLKNTSFCLLLRIIGVDPHPIKSVIGFSRQT